MKQSGLIKGHMDHVRFASVSAQVQDLSRMWHRTYESSPSGENSSVGAVLILCSKKQAEIVLSVVAYW